MNDNKLYAVLYTYPGHSVLAIVEATSQRNAELRAEKDKGRGEVGLVKEFGAGPLERGEVVRLVRVDNTYPGLYEFGP